MFSNLKLLTKWLPCDLGARFRVRDRICACLNGGNDEKLVERGGEISRSVACNECQHSQLKKSFWTVVFLEERKNDELYE